MKIIYRPQFPNSLLGILFLVFVCSYAVAQTPTTELDSSSREQPNFVGGEAKLLDYLGDHYPTAFLYEGIEARVFIHFTVRTDGKISDIEVLEAHYVRAFLFPNSEKIKRIPIIEKLDPQMYRKFNRKLVKMVEGMPKWSPAIRGSIPIKMAVTLPIVYKLDKTNTPFVQIWARSAWF